MLKKFIAVVAMFVFAATLTATAAPSKVDQSTKEATIASYITAVFVDQSTENVWAVYSPDLRKQLIAKFGNEAKAKEAIKGLWSAYHAETLKMLKARFQDKKIFKETVQNVMNAYGEGDIVKLNGKWYLNKI